jgi:hypothetical protein
MISPLTVTLQVTYTDNEQQFLLQAVEAAVKTFRSLNGNHLTEVSSTSTAQDQLT